MAEPRGNVSLWLGERLQRREFVGWMGRRATALAVATTLALTFTQRADANICAATCCVNGSLPDSCCYCCSYQGPCPTDPSCYAYGCGNYCNFDSDCTGP